jgi:acetylornithine/succinyldiaminopimelate/putrescine aminotransferase/predicted amino acid dehydrogenase
LAGWAEQKALDEDLDGIIFAHVHDDWKPPFDALRQREYVRLPSLGYATLTVKWSNLDQYVEQLRAGHRRQVLASLSRLKEEKLEICPELDLASHAEEFLPLYRAVFDRAEQRIEAINADFFRKLAELCPEETGLLGIRKEGRLVAGAVTMHVGARLCCLEVGLDYAVQARSDLYLNLLLALTDRAGRTGAAWLDLGQTALAAKANLGARIEHTWLYVKARSPLVQAALRVERTDLCPPAFPQRKVFRDIPAQSPAARTNAQDRLSATGGEWARHVNPDLAAFLAVLRADRVFVRGEGHCLWDAEGREIFDAAAGYGALPFGHNPEWLWEQVMDLARRRAPHFVQGSLAPEAGELAALLCHHAPESIRYCLFANSGAEAIEIAIKAARAATGRPDIVVARGAFHGKTLGALSATADSWYQEPFFAPAPGFVHVNYGDLQDLETALEERRGNIAAFLVEPIQSEAGVIVPPSGYLRMAAELCARHGVLFLVDEVQTGLGRLGVLFTCAEEEIQPDAITLSKALGGGLVPAAACLLSGRAWSEKLAMRHSSTFAGSALAATVGLAVVRKLLADDGKFLKDVKRAGAEWCRRLHDIAATGYSISAVRGRGLLYGLEIGRLEHAHSPTLRSLSREGKLVPLLCGYLLNIHNLRVMPPLARKTALRLLPPLNAPTDLLDRTTEALADMSQRLDRGDLRGLTRYLLGESLPQCSFPVRKARACPPHPALTTLAGTFAFITHALDWQSYQELEPSLAGAPDLEVASYERIMRDTAEVVHLSEVVLKSRTGAFCQGWFLGLPFTSRELLALQPEDAHRWVRKGVLTAKKLGAGIVGLGALTSVVSNGGIALRDEGVGITTGNSYTVAAAMESLSLAARKLGIRPEDEVCAVIGANGAIGRACALLCAEFSGHVILVGRQNGKDTTERLARLAREIEQEAARKTDIQWTTDIAAAVGSARLIICATSSPDPVIKTEWLRRGSIVCDIARPSDLPAGARGERDDVLILDGGVVSLPERVSLGWNFGFEPGTVYACMAETISLAFDGWRDHYGLGPRGVIRSYKDAWARAKRHGFEVVGIRSSGRPVSEEEIERIRRSSRLISG